MPRRSQKRRLRRPRNSSSLFRNLSGPEMSEQNNTVSGIVRVPFRAVFQVALSTQAIPLSLSVSPLAMGGRLAAISPMFSAFRFRKLRATLLPVRNATFNLALGYNPYFLDSFGPSSYIQVLDSFPVTTTLGSGQSTPSHMEMTGKVLFENSPRWFKTIEGSEPNSLSEQGQIWVGCDVPPGSPTFNLVLLVDGLCELSAPVLTGESVSIPQVVQSPSVSEEKWDTVSVQASRPKLLPGPRRF